MIILGVDPGLATTGYGLVEHKGNRFKLLDFGAIRTGSDLPFNLRLQTIFRDLSGIIREYNPQVMAVEELFFNRNVKTALMVGQARGVILLAGSEAGLRVFEYTPLQVKQAVVGYGRAKKEQVQEMVRVLLNLREIPSPKDAADALAVCICHGHSRKVTDRLKEMME